MTACAVTTRDFALERSRRAPERGLQPASGSTGHWPVAPGNLPSATAARPRIQNCASTFPCALLVPGSTRALACCVPRPRGTPEDVNIFHTPDFSIASHRPGRARVGTREGACAPHVAQTSGLPYRRLAVCGPLEVPTRVVISTLCRWQIGDTADWKSALRAKASRVALKFGIWNLFGIWDLGLGVSTQRRHCSHALSPVTIRTAF